MWHLKSYQTLNVYEPVHQKCLVWRRWIASEGTGHPEGKSGVTIEGWRVIKDIERRAWKNLWLIVLTTFYITLMGLQIRNIKLMKLSFFSHINYVLSSTVTLSSCHREMRKANITLRRVMRWSRKKSPWPEWKGKWREALLVLRDCEEKVRGRLGLVFWVSSIGWSRVPDKAWVDLLAWEAEYP